MNNLRIQIGGYGAGDAEWIFALEVFALRQQVVVQTKRLRSARNRIYTVLRYR